LAEGQRLRERFLASSNGGPHRAALAVSSDRIDRLLSGRLAEAIGASPAVLTDAFVSDGVFADVMAGAHDQLRAAELERVVKLMVLAELSSRDESSLVAGETVFKSTCQLRVVVLRLADGYSADSFTTEGVGAGFSNEAAERAAIDQAAGAAVSKLSQYR
jgi:hypothetical protein